MASWHICLGLEGKWHGQWPSLEAELKDPVLLGLARSRIWGWLGLLVNECKDMLKKQKKQCIRFYDQCLMLFACPTFWPRHVLVVLGLWSFRTSPYSQLLMALLIVILVGHRACGGLVLHGQLHPNGCKFLRTCTAKVAPSLERVWKCAHAKLAAGVLYRDDHEATIKESWNWKC